MGYLHVSNLYKDQTILNFKRIYALEKIHGTSAHIKWNAENQSITFFSGGESHVNFLNLFDQDFLKSKFLEFFPFISVTIFGEAYGGRQQGMSATYGTALKFIAFDVQVDDEWLNVPKAEQLVLDLGLEFVYYKEISIDLSEIDDERDADSEQAIRNGVGVGKKREGVILRPLEEFTAKYGRVICKHKRDEFIETKTPRTVNTADLKVLENAGAIADEWVVPMRLAHVLDKLVGEKDIQLIPKVIAAMVEDVYREGKGEIVESKATTSAIGKKTVVLYKQYLNSLISKAIISNGLIVTPFTESQVSDEVLNKLNGSENAEIIRN
jgi:hypothetical protein